MASVTPQLQETDLTPTEKKMCQNLASDLISGLPDDILIRILSLLLMRENVATSLLSRRWRNLWKSVPILRFDVVNRCGLKEELKWVDYRDWVNGVLRQLSDLNSIQEFSISNYSGNEINHYIGEWVSFALLRKVRKLHLSLDSYYVCGVYLWHSGLTSIFEETASSVTELNLGGFYVDSPRFGSFKSLTSLSLVDVHLNDAVIESFLSNCPLLECFIIRSVQQLVNVTVVGPTLRLRHLELVCCFSLKRVEIDAQKLEAFTCDTPADVLVIRNAPKLVYVNLGCEDDIMVMCDTFNRLNTIAGQVETLCLGAETMEVDAVSFGKCPIFNHLKVLILSFYRLEGFPWFLEACPFLQKLVLYSYFNGDEDFNLKESDFCHPHLKQIDLIHFQGQPCEFRLAVYLLKASCGLEKLIIHLEKYSLARQTTEFARDSWMELLMALPPWAELVIC